jgi:hypothetical protein
MKRHRIILSIIGLIAAATSILGWAVYFSHGSVSAICWPFIWLGIFTWDDGMILGTFLFVACAILWKKNKPALSGLFFSAYAMVRSFIEALYNLNAQFSSVSRPWENYLPQLAANLHLQVVELYVIAQISYTAICVTALVFLLYYTKKYFAAD